MRAGGCVGWVGAAGRGGEWRESGGGVMRGGGGGGGGAQPSLAPPPDIRSDMRLI